MKLINNLVKRVGIPFRWFMRKAWPIKLGVLLVILAILWLGYTSFFKPKQKPQYQTAQVEKGMIVSSVSASGQVLTTNIVNITTDASGLVKEVYVKDGDTVKAGQKIVQIELDTEGQQQNASAWSSYLTAKNSRESARATQYTLGSSLFDTWDTFYQLATNSTYQNSDGSPNESNRALPEFHIAKDNWLASEAKYKNQEAVIAQTNAALRSAWLSYQSTSATVTSPIAGTVSNIGIIPGMILASSSSSSNSTTTTSSSQRVAIIQNEIQPIISVNLTEIDVPQVKIGQKTTITLDSLPDLTFTGVVATVDRIGTTENNVTSYSSLIKLDTASTAILPNMAATAHIITATKSNILLVPSAAVQTHNDQVYVRVLRNGNETQIPVTTGISNDTQTEITSGLSEGDIVITGSVSTQSQTTGSVFGGGGFGGAGFRTGGGGR